MDINDIDEIKFQGMIYLIEGNLDAAINCFQNCLKLEPDDVDIYNSLAYALTEQGKNYEAIAYLQKAFQLQPDIVDSYNNFLLKLLRTGESNTAILSAISALQVKPTWSQCYLYLGYALQQQDRHSEARDCGLGLLPSHLLKEFCPLIQDWLIISKSAPGEQINYLDIHPKSQININPPLTLDDNYHPTFLETPIQFSETFVAIVPNSRIWVDFYTSAIITSDHQLVTDVSIGNSALIATSDKLPPITNIEGTAACLAIRYSSNYFHWMFDLLPRIELLRLSGIDLNSINNFIINNYDYAFQKETLNSFGVNEDKIIYNGDYSYIQVNQVLIPSSPFNIGIIPQWSCEFLRRQFLPSQTIKSSQPERIYISRHQASYRRVFNEDILISFLQKLGFESYTLEALSVAEQASLFAGAKVIIAPHGAGLTNIVFCNPGTKVIEIFLPNEILTYYWIISHQIHLEYYYFIGEMIQNSSPSQPPNQPISIVTNQEDILVNLDSLLNLMKFAGVV